MHVYVMVYMNDKIHKTDYCSVVQVYANTQRSEQTVRTSEK